MKSQQQSILKKSKEIDQEDIQQYEQLKKKVKTNSESESQDKILQQQQQEEEQIQQDNSSQSNNDPIPDQMNEEDLLKLIDDAEKDETLQFDKDSLSKLINQLSNNINKNQELRQKFIKQPSQFFDSEQEVYNCVKKFISLPSYPELINQFLNSSAPQNLILLLTHENNDICIEAINFFLEMVKFENNEDILLKILKQFINSKLIEQLVTTLNKLQENVTEEYDAANNILEIFDKIIELDPQNSSKIGAQAQFIQWCIARINKVIPSKVIDDNKQYMSELLTIILADEECALDFGKNGGLEQILIFLSKYKNLDPQSEEDKETILNFFSCICEMLTVKDNIIRFQELQGLELMLILLRKKNFSSINTLKVIDYCLQENSLTCSNLVKLQGLKYIMPILLKQGIKSKKENEQQSIDESVLSIIRSLLFFNKSVDLERSVNKFRENSFEKIDRLIEMHIQYYAKILAVEKKIEEPKYLAQLKEDAGKDADINEVKYRAMLEEGLSILENIDILIVFLYNWMETDISEKIMKTVKMRQNLVTEIQQIVHQYLVFVSNEIIVKPQIQQYLEAFIKVKSQ